MEIDRFRSAIELAMLAHWHTHSRSTNDFYIEHARNNAQIICQKCEPLLINGDGMPDSWYLLFALLCGDWRATRGEPTFNELESLSDEASQIYSRYERQQ